jgi:hypothetical protein
MMQISVAEHLLTQGVATLISFDIFADVSSAFRPHIQALGQFLSKFFADCLANPIRIPEVDCSTPVPEGIYPMTNHKVAVGWLASLLCIREGVCSIHTFLRDVQLSAMAFGLF